MLRNGGFVVEVLLIRRRADLKWALPGSFIKGVPASLTKAFGLEQTSDGFKELKNFLDQNANKLYSVCVIHDCTV